MRNKIKQIMKKEEGFTLVELLAVIVILGIIVAIAIPSIGNVISDAETSANESEYELIEDAARLYEVDQDNTITTGKGSGVKVTTLINEGYLDTDKEYTDETVDKIQKDSGSGFDYVFSGR